MASCTRIEGMVQAYVDGELSMSDRVILEEHVSSCTSCTVLVHEHRRLSADLFEGFSAHRLARDLRRPVVENLPEMELLSTDLEGVNWRAKHRNYARAVFARYVPAAAIIVVAVLGLIIKENWPDAAPAGETIGVVTRVAGEVTHVAPEETAWTGAFLEDIVRRGERFETGAGARLLVGLRGPSLVKLNEHSRITIDDARRVSLEQGEIWLDIGKDGRLFRVNTPNGSITVYGTAFAVRVDSGCTTVAVERGEVLVSGEESFTNLSQGQQVTLASDSGLGKPERVAVKSIAPWARTLQADAGAEEVFQKMVIASSGTAEVAGKQAFFIEPPAGSSQWAFTAINLYWERAASRRGHCSYDVYVYDDQGRPLFLKRVGGTTFDSPTRASLEIPVPGSPIVGVRQLVVRLIPDFTGGSVEPANISVSGMVQGSSL